MKNDEQRTIRILCVLGIIPMVWLALLVAPFVSGGLMEIVAQFPAAMDNPFHIELCQDSKKTVLIFMLIYGLGIGVALSSRRHYRRGEEHGSAKWGSASAINRKYRAKDPEANKVFTKHIRMGLDGRKHRRNLFEKQWESILGNCDEFLYLGGNETGTHKMIAESYLGKETIDMNTYGKSSGRSGNYSTNWQITGRELLDAAEVRMMDNRYALLFIRGEMPVMDEKYDLLNHPNVKYTPEKGGAPYVHGGTELSVASMSVTSFTGRITPTMSIFENDFELLSDEEIEAELFGGNKDESN